MKIAVCTHRLTGGGAERVASLWIKGFVDQGHEVSVILGDSYQPQTYSIPDCVKVYDVNPHIPIHKLRYGWMMIDKGLKLRKMKQNLHTINPDVVISVLPHWGPLIYEAKGSIHFKVIGTDHNAYELPEGIEMSELQKYLKFEFNKRFDAVTVLTNADKTYISSLLSNVFVLPNPLTFKPVDTIPEKKKIIMASGRLDVWHVKGFDVLIKAWGEVAHRHPDWILQIAGSASKDINYRKILDFISEANVQHSVNLLGFCEDIQSLYKDASIFVLSSRYEGFGMVLTEAMSQGCACIACDYKGRQKEIIRDPSEGIVCSPDDVNELAEAIDRMICDDDYRKAVQIRSVERSNDFSLEKIMDKWNTIMNEI